ncbi:MAG TPA: hypothetical protein VG796_15025 [Verrucomicrobiales bacterium]|jgi:hypothetical protein|nr:hypothetical protein [Verrucomicrobiales bacterium]
MTPTTPRRIAPASSVPATGVYSPVAGAHQDFDDGPHGDLVLPADSVGMAPENLAERVQTTQNRLSQLRAEAEALEREKQQFEELSRKQQDFMQGRAEMAEKLSRSIAMLDRETYEAQKRVEQLLVIKDGFHQHLDVVDSLNPEQWNPQDLQHDLTRSLGIIEDAREEYKKAIARVQMLTNAAAPAVAAAPVAVPQSNLREPSQRSTGLSVEISLKTFRTWAFCGAAFTLPLIVTALLYMLVRLFSR